VFADEHGIVGAGCLREVADATAAGIPVGYLDPCFGLCELAAVDFFPCGLRTRARTAWPVAGRPLRWTLANGEVEDAPTAPHRGR
jgi:hypothetical protein